MSTVSSPSQTPRAVLLDAPLRRRICAILAASDPPRAERDLAVELAARSLGVAPRAVTTEQRRRTRIQLHHHQLPKLAEYGLVTYSRDRQTAAITPTGREALAAVTANQPR